VDPDYDAPRAKRPEDDTEEPLEPIAVGVDGAATALVDVDDGDPVDAVDVPDAELLGDELTVAVMPKRADEFVCSRCFLVFHRHRMAPSQRGHTTLRRRRLDSGRADPGQRRNRTRSHTVGIRRAGG
jgi:hypothetical protein